jgi:hypothetical protein
MHLHSKKNSVQSFTMGSFVELGSLAGLDRAEPHSDSRQTFSNCAAADTTD